MTGFTTVAFAVLTFSRFGDAAITGWTGPVNFNPNGADVKGTIDPVPENTQGSWSITFVAVTDTPSITYDLTSQNPTGVFAINGQSGVLTVIANQVLDYEAHTSHSVIVSATDASSSTGTATVSIPISDVDDAPAFAQSLYAANVPDESNPGTTVITVTATIENVPLPNIYYVIVADSNTDADFAVHPNGIISVANDLSASRTKHYTLVVQATDSGSPPQTGSTMVNVCVSKGGVINGWTSPVTSSVADADGTVSGISEETSVPFSIVFSAMSTATIPSFVYQIISQIPADVFDINSASGVLSVADDKKLDYETHQSHILTVTATDDCATGTATVTIQISEANDAPVFPQSSYTVNVPDGSPGGASVLTVTATDENESSPNNEIISYSFFEKSNTDLDFAIADNGTISVANELSAARTARYALIVHALDGGTPTLTGSTTVSVCVGCDNGEGIPGASLMLVLASVLLGIQHYA